MNTGLSLINSDLFTWVILPVLIFLARITDQSIGTLRLIFISKGLKHIAPFLGFFEVIIWLLAIGQIMQHLDNWLCYVAYGAGFATGNYIGIVLEEKLSLGVAIIRVILDHEDSEMIAELKEQNFGLTLIKAEGMKGPVKVIFSTIRRKEITTFVEIVNRHNPGSFYTIEEVKHAKEGVFREMNSPALFGSFASRLMKTK
jgi:uncharacterized protein YebE (UPF0316 family)